MLQMEYMIFETDIPFFCWDLRSEFPKRTNDEAEFGKRVFATSKAKTRPTVISPPSGMLDIHLHPGTASEEVLSISIRVFASVSHSVRWVGNISLHVQALYSHDMLCPPARELSRDPPNHPRR